MSRDRADSAFPDYADCSDRRSNSPDHSSRKPRQNPGRILPGTVAVPWKLPDSERLRLRGSSPISGELEKAGALPMERSLKDGAVIRRN
jgi:hypothetical protein